MNVNDRLSALERSNRRLKRSALAVCAALGCGVLLAAGGLQDAAYDNLSVRHNLVVGGPDTPSIALVSRGNLAAIVVQDKEQHRRAEFRFDPEAKTVRLRINDQHGDQAFEAAYWEDFDKGKPSMAVKLQQPGDKSDITLVTGNGKAGIVIGDKAGEARAKLDISGVTRIK
jgi:hypothetical protein